MEKEIKKAFLIWVKKDQEYTIREVLNNDGIVTGFLLEEIHNFPCYFHLIKRNQEPAFATWRFRKIEKQELRLEVSEKTEKLETIKK